MMVMEKNAYLNIVGDTPINRLLDFFMTGREFDYTLTDLANKAGVSWSTIHRVFPQLEKNKIVVLVREVGRAKLYKLNLANPVVKKFISLYDTIILQEMGKAEKKVLVTV